MVVFYPTLIETKPPPEEVEVHINNMKFNDKNRLITNFDDFKFHFKSPDSMRYNPQAFYDEKYFLNNKFALLDYNLFNIRRPGFRETFGANVGDKKINYQMVLDEFKQITHKEAISHILKNKVSSLRRMDYSISGSHYDNNSLNDKSLEGVITHYFNQKDKYKFYKNKNYVFMSRSRAKTYIIDHNRWYDLLDHDQFHDMIEKFHS